MADLVIVAADVLQGEGLVAMVVTAGDSVQAGMPVYMDTEDGNLYKPCDNVDASAAESSGVAMNGAARGQPLAVATEGPLIVSDVLTVGEVYVVGSTAGAICPVADLSDGDFVTVLGIAVDTDTLELKIHASGVQLGGLSPSP